MCCDSAHKTLPVLTGGAYLHLGPSAPVQDETIIRNTLNLFGSTSPSYLILQSLDAANAALAGDWPQRLAECCKTLDVLRAQLNTLAAGCGAILPLALPGNTADREPLKLTLDAAALSTTGGALAKRLRTHKVECEYADPRYLVMMFTPDNPSRDYTRVREAVAEACAAFVPAEENAVLPKQNASAVPDFSALERELRQTPPRCTIREAIFAAQEQISVAEALDRICALPTVSCPPAIPITVSGEVVTAAAVRLMQQYGIESLSVLK